MNRRRASAIAAIMLATSGIGLGAVEMVLDFPGALMLVGCVVAAILASSYAALRRGMRRGGGFAIAALALAGAVAAAIALGRPIEHFALVIVVVLTIGAAREAFAVRARLSPVAAPRKPVLFLNPRSGGGKAARFHLADEARARRIEPIELQPDDDLAALVRAAIDRGADALAMAGGDGSQAIVAAIAAERGVPYACVPSGTRNHFALDLGVDRHDPVGALDAFVDGNEHQVDLGDVNGRAFVNNVSLGVYGEAVQRGGYRDAKLKTLLDTMPDVLGPESRRTDLQWQEPDGRTHAVAAAILIANNPYRLGQAVGSGTRPRLDGGLLGIAIIDAPPTAGAARPAGPPWRQWSAPLFEVEASSPIPAGVDGEAVMLEPPLRFSIRRRVLRVRVSRRHPGASPSAGMPDSLGQGVRSLLDIARARPISGG